MRVLLCAGEASGDAYGAALVRELRSRRPDLEFGAIGGRRLAAEGVDMIADSSHWGAIGIAQSTVSGLRALRSYHRLKRTLSSAPPGLFVPIDFGFMNVRLARHAKAKGWRVLYFMPPASWRRDRQGKDLPEITDAISTPFEWSADLLSAAGARAYWYGHPIKQLLGPYREPQHRLGIAVLPGSRVHEIESNLPVIAGAVDGPVEFALTSSVPLEKFRANWRALRSDSAQDLFTVGDTAGVLRRARAAIVCSGTATLEAALCRTPSVVIYRGTRAMQIEEKLIRYRRPKFISLPNIALDRQVLPELIQDDASEKNIRSHLATLLVDGPERAAQLAAFEELDVLLGGSDAISKTTELALSLIGD